MLVKRNLAMSRGDTRTLNADTRHVMKYMRTSEEGEARIPTVLTVSDETSIQESKGQETQKHMGNEYSNRRDTEGWGTFAAAFEIIPSFRTKRSRMQEEEFLEEMPELDEIYEGENDSAEGSLQEEEELTEETSTSFENYEEDIKEERSTPQGKGYIENEQKLKPRHQPLVFPRTPFKIYEDETVTDELNVLNDGVRTI
jgi:hypothetical protein